MFEERPEHSKSNLEKSHRDLLIAECLPIRNATYTSEEKALRALTSVR